MQKPQQYQQFFFASTINFTAINMDKELKGKQCAAVERMLNLNGSSLAADQWSDQWKVLIYDSAGRDIISPLLNVAQLRRNGVTLHMLVISFRTSIRFC
jgi:sec1 family domain-containing protein 1